MGNITYLPQSDRPAEVKVHQGSLAARLELPGAFQKGEVRRLFEEAPGFVAVLKGSRRTFALANPGFIELVGGRNLIGRSLPEAFPDLEGQALLSLIDKVWETGLSITRRGEPLILQRELGHPPEVRYVDFVCQTITGQDGSITGVFLQGHDATEQKRVEEQMRLALRGGKVAAWERDLTTNHVRWSENATEILGITSGPFQEFAERIHPEDRVVHRAALEALMTCGTPYTIEVRFVRSCGTTIWIEHRGEIHAGLDGRRSLVGVTADITKRKVAELEAQEKSCLLEATLENMDQGLMVVDGSQRVLLCNQRAAALLDLPSELMARRPHLEEIKQYQLQMGEFLEGGEKTLHEAGMQGFAFDPCQYERIRPNGTVLEIRTVTGEDGGAVRTYTDITARRLAETELRENEARFRRELEAAAAVQRSLLPHDGSIGPVSYTGLLRSCSLIGGDTYNVIDLHDGKLAFFQIDTCGHGAAAALASVAAHHMVTQAARRPGNRDAAELVRALNENWPEDLPYFTMIYGELETATGRGVLVQAGHPSPLLVEKTGRITALGEGGVPVGIDESSSYATIPFSLDSGDRLLLYSDGVVEAENDLDEAYSDARLQALVTQNAHVTSRDFLEILELDVRSWCGPTGVEDDISALVLERTF